MATATVAPDLESAAASGDRSFLGHPRGLAFLAFTEAWERFSYYGMTSLLVLYMTGALLLPGHVESIAGFAAFRSMLESLRGPLSNQALAAQIFGLYAGFVYFTPVFGGLIADRWIGQRNAVVIGALLMSGGHLAMAFDRSFLLALLLLVIGSGLLKGNIAAQVGALYPEADEERRTRGFAIFSTAINFGAVAGPLACGLLAQLYGWHIGFGAAAVLMLIGLATYLSGYRHLPAKVEHRHEPAGKRLTAAEWKKVAALVAVMLISIFQSIAYYEVNNGAPIWFRDHVDLSVGGLIVPVPWFESIDPMASIVGVPLLFALWRWQAKRGREPHDIGKIGTGAWIAAASNLVLVAGIAIGGNGRISILWPLTYCIGLGIAFLYYWPTLLALVSRAAPASINATLMGCCYTTLFLGNNIIGWIAGFYERMTPQAFWALHAAIAATGGFAILLFGRALARVLEPEEVT